MATKRINELTQTASQADLKAGRYGVLDTPAGTKKLPGNLIASGGGGGGTVDIVDNLTTADPTKALSANMGRTLNEKFQYKNYLAGKNLDQKGNILDAEGWNVTAPIAVVGGTALTFECGGTNTSALCEYDADGNFLDYWGQSVHPRTITTKANTAYVRLAVPNNPTQDYFVAQDVVLFNKLHDFDIVEQVAENTQKLENIGDNKAFRTQPAAILEIKGTKTTSYLYVGDRWKDPNLAQSKTIIFPVTFTDTSCDFRYRDSFEINFKTGEWRETTKP